MQSGRSVPYCCRRAVCGDALVTAEELTGGNGGATPAVCEPRPNCCSVFASSLPLGFNPCASWNFLMASIVDASHFPFGFPVNEPSFASACWISEMRSGVGAFCPRSRRLDFFEDLVRCDALPDFEGAAFVCEVPEVCVCVANTLDAVAKSSAIWAILCKRMRIRPVRSLIDSQLRPIAGCPPSLCQTNRASGCGRCPVGGEP